MTDEIVVATTVHAPPEAVFARLDDVAGYEAYSEYVEGVTRHGDGGPGTVYDVALGWWKLAHTVRLRVTGRDPPERIDWRVVGDLDARGAWTLDPVAVDDPSVEAATRVTLTVRYAPDSADDDALSLPPLVPVSAVVDRARPVVEAEVQRVADRLVADVEGSSRRASVSIETGSDGN